MENFQAAMNYEAIVMATGKNDNFCSSLMDKVSNLCDINKALPFNIKAYSTVLALSQTTIEEAYRKCRKAFEKLEKEEETNNITIIDNKSSLWNASISGIRYLYLKGKKELLLTRSVSVVGTRSPSPRGVELAREVVDSLGEKGFTIVSGLALGIDGISHIEALSKDFPTIGVLGTSVCDVYPKQHEKLQALMAQHGLVVSQFAPSREIQKYFFLQRNLLMSQISLASFVVEDRDGGGGVQQAQYCASQGKKVFILKETMDNRTFLWPRKLKDPVVVAKTSSVGTAVKKELQKTTQNSVQKLKENTAQSMVQIATQTTLQTTAQTTVQTQAKFPKKTKKPIVNDEQPTLF